MKRISIFIISLHQYVIDEEFENFLKSNHIFGTQVSYLTNKYVVEIPVQEEEKYKQLFQECDLVKRVTAESKSCTTESKSNVQFQK